MNNQSKRLGVIERKKWTESTVKISVLVKILPNQPKMKEDPKLVWKINQMNLKMDNYLNDE